MSPSSGPSFSIARNAPPLRRSASSNVQEINDALDRSLLPQAVLLPEGMNIREGQHLWEGIKFGRFIGAGVQARVFELVKTDGSPSGKVIKVAHADLGHRFLNSPVIWIGGEREWEIGLQLRIALQKEDGSLPGFMRVYDCVVVENGKKVSFAGMTMEKLQGWEVHKRLLQPDFHNIHYVREMLYQVFSALDVAQRKLGFHHADLGMRNIMEMYSKVYADVEEAEVKRSLEALEESELEGRGDSAASEVVAAHAVAASVVAEEHVARSSPAKREAHARVAPIRGFTCSSKGKLMPLGPRVEFKIIDYGVAIFNEDLAESTGGNEYRAVLQRIKDVLVAKEIVFPSRDSKAEQQSLVVSTSTSAIGRATHAWHLLPTKLKNKFRVVQTPIGAYPVLAPEPVVEHGIPALGGGVGSTTTNNNGTTDSSSNAGSSLDLLSQRSASGGTRRQYARISGSTRRLFRGSGAPTLDDPVVNPQSTGETIDPYSMSPIERMYRNFWRRKGDVFHILLSVGMALDNRVWPKQDEELVREFATLVFHCTGVKIRVSFAQPSTPNGFSDLYGTLDRAQGLRDQKLEKQRGTKQKKGADILRSFGLRRRWTGPFRRFHMICKAHLHPYNSGMHAAEALTSPFFGIYRESTPPEVPISLEKVFPGAVQPPENEASEAKRARAAQTILKTKEASAAAVAKADKQ